MDFAKLAKAASATDANAIKYAESLEQAMGKYAITSAKERGMFIAQVAIESGYLRTTEEGLYYKDAQYLAKTFKRVFGGDAAKAAPFTRNSKALSQKLYDGYHGRGLIQLTWLDNYRAFSQHSGIDYVNNPDWLLRPLDAAMSAAWYFAVKTDCRTPANKDDVTAVTRLINGDALMHLAERKAQYSIAMSVPGL